MLLPTDTMVIHAVWIYLQVVTTAKIRLLLPNIHIYIYIPNHDKPVDCILFNSV